MANNGELDASKIDTSVSGVNVPAEGVPGDRRSEGVPPAPHPGQDANRVQVATINLDEARTNQERPLGGNFIFVLSSTVTGSVLDVAPEDENNGAFPLGEEGPSCVRGFRGIAFNSLYISNNNEGAGETITLMVYQEQPIRPVEVFQQNIDPGQLKIAGNNTFDSLSDVSINAGSTTQIVAGSATRRKVMLSNPEGNSREINIGDSGVGATNGIEIYPGQPPITLTVADAPIHGHNPHTAAQNITVAEVSQ